MPGGRRHEKGTKQASGAHAPQGRQAKGKAPEELTTKLHNTPTAGKQSANRQAQYEAAILPWKTKHKSCYIRRARTYSTVRGKPIYLTMAARACSTAEANPPY